MPSNNSANKQEKMKHAGDKADGSAVGKVVDAARDYLKAVSYDTKDDYRQFFLSADLMQTRIIVAFLALTIGLFAISDYMFFNLSTIFYALLLLRLGLSRGETFS